MNIGQILLKGTNYNNLLDKLKTREVCKVFPTIHVNWAENTVSAGASYVTREDFIKALIIVAAEFDCTPDEFYDKYTDYTGGDCRTKTKVI